MASITPPCRFVRFGNHNIEKFTFLMSILEQVGLKINQRLTSALKPQVDALHCDTADNMSLWGAKRT